MREKVPGIRHGDDEADQKRCGEDDVVREQVVLEVDRPEQDEHRAEDGPDEGSAAEAEVRKARDE
jgi:hypothetical protein